jgi:putative ABC transport system permease protein
MGSVGLDIKYAIRSIRSSPRFAAVVVATLALGIGANTAVFGVLYAAVLKPLAYDEPERLVRVYHSAGGEDTYMPGPEAVAYRDRSRTLEFAPVFTYNILGADLTDRAEPERVRTLSVSADYFGVLRVHPILGRAFERDDERRDARVAVVSARIWRTYLGGRGDAIGHPLSLNGIPHRVVAVLPDGFEDPLESSVDVWTPLDLQPGGNNSWDNYYLSAIGRLRPGATLDDARAELATLADALGTEIGSKGRFTAHVAPLQIDTIGSARPMLWILLGAVGLLLVIACVNVASLLLARGAARQTELAVRAALGCSNARLVRQLLIESLLLSLAGAAAGLLLARAVTGALVAAAPPAVARAGGGALEHAVLIFSALVAIVGGIASGTAPALHATRTDLDAALRESSRSGAGRRQTRARHWLVVCQVALALVLLVGAGLLLRSFDRLRSVALGVRASNVVVFDVHLPSGRYEDPERRARFHRDFLARLNALPGVRAAGAISRLPATGSFHSWGAQRGDAPPDTRFTQAQQRVIEGPYFDALGIPVLRGRTFDARDDAHAPRRVVISQALVRQLYPTEDPIGKTLRVAGANLEIIGVVGDVALGPRLPVRGYVYHSHSQFAADRNWDLTQAVAIDRSRAADVPALLASIRGELSRIDPALVLYQPQMLDEVIGGGVAQDRFALMLVAAFAVLAVALAAIGIYSVLSYAVSRRRREIGIRMALGAPKGALRSMIVGDGARLAGIGVAIGWVAAFGAARLLRSMLFEVSASEPLTFAAAAGLLVGVAVTASALPAIAATRTDPLDAVRE